MKPRPKQQAAMFSGRDALAYQQRQGGDEAPSQAHVQKRQRKEKGLEVVFDPIGHKSFVTGFHKRKVKRRKEAQQKLEAKGKQQRLEDRKTRREEMRQRLDLDKYLDPAIIDPEGSKKQQGIAAGSAAAGATAQAAPAAVDFFDCDGVTTTVTTIALNSDDEAAAPTSGAPSSEEASEASSGSDGGGAESDPGGSQASDSGCGGGFPEVFGTAPLRQPARDGSGAAAAGDSNGEEEAGTADVAPTLSRGPAIDRGVVLRPPRSMKRKRQKERKEKRLAKEQGKRGPAATGAGRKPGKGGVKGSGGRGAGQPGGKTGPKAGGGGGKRGGGKRR